MPAICGQGQLPFWSGHRAPRQPPLHDLAAAVEKLLSKAPELKANFSRAQGALSQARTQKVARYLPNPEANWGPKPRHSRARKAAPQEGEPEGTPAESATEPAPEQATEAGAQTEQATVADVPAGQAPNDQAAAAGGGSANGATA